MGKTPRKPTKRTQPPAPEQPLGPLFADIEPPPTVAPPLVNRSPWHADLTHRMRVLLHTFPLHDLRRNDTLRDSELRHYDALALALCAFDLIIDRTGIDDRVGRAEVAHTLEPLLRAMDQAEGVPEDARRHGAMVDLVLARLRNDLDGRRPFTAIYNDFDGDGAKERRLEFRLLADAHHPAGGTVLRLSNEAINLYLNALELDIEDAQAATEAIVQSQLARGRFDEAVHSARQARWQSTRFREKVLGVLKETRRDVERVDWRVAVPTLLGEALTHVQARLDVERAILSVTDERLDVLPLGDERSRAVAQVAELIRMCQMTHAELHAELMRARNVFLDTQARQEFVPTATRLLPDLRNDVLSPLLALPCSEALRITDVLFPAFFGAASPPQLSLVALVDWQLQPRRGVGRGEVDEAAPDLDHGFVEEIRRYPESILQEARAYFARSERVTLSSLLAELRAQGVPAELMEAVVFLCLQRFAGDEIDPSMPHTERVPGSALTDPDFFGDELQITRSRNPP